MTCNFEQFNNHALPVHKLWQELKHMAHQIAWKILVLLCINRLSFTVCEPVKQYQVQMCIVALMTACWQNYLCWEFYASYVNFKSAHFNLQSVIMDSIRLQSKPYNALQKNMSLGIHFQKPNAIQNPPQFKPHSISKCLQIRWCGNMCCHRNGPMESFGTWDKEVKYQTNSNTYRILPASHKLENEIEEKKERILQSRAHLSKFPLLRFFFFSLFLISISDFFFLSLCIR